MTNPTESESIRLDAINECVREIESGFSLADADTEFSDGIKYGLESAVKWVRSLSDRPRSENKTGTEMSTNTP